MHPIRRRALGDSTMMPFRRPSCFPPGVGGQRLRWRRIHQPQNPAPGTLASSRSCPWSCGRYARSSARKTCLLRLPVRSNLRSLTGFALGDLVAFRPERLVLHEVLVRVTADLSVPDGSRIEDLGINFREMTRRLLAGYLDPRMADITAAFATIRRQLGSSIEAALADVSEHGAVTVATASDTVISVEMGRTHHSSPRGAGGGGGPCNPW